jgi:hypothetical protein
MWQSLTTLMTMTKKLYDDMDKCDSQGEIDKSSATLTDGQSAEKRVQSIQATIHRQSLQEMTRQSSATHIGENGAGPWFPFMNFKSLVQRFSEAVRTEYEGVSTVSITALNMSCHRDQVHPPRSMTIEISMTTLQSTCVPFVRFSLKPMLPRGNWKPHPDREHQVTISPGWEPRSAQDILECVSFIRCTRV